MTDVPAGWFPDPYGRYAQRYWDGARWTEHVATGGVQAVDPMGSSPVIPVATPATQWQPPAAAATAVAPGDTPTTDAVASADDTAVAATASSPVIRLLDSLGPDARARPRPLLTTALAGIGGAIAGFGLLILIAGDSNSRLRVGIAGAVVVAIAWAARFFLRAAEPRAAGTGAGAVGIAALGIAISLDGNGQPGTVTGLVLAVLYLAAWSLPGFRGRTLYLAIAAISLVAAFGSLTAPDPTDVFEESIALPSVLTNAVGDQGFVWLVGAAALLGLTWWLDRKGYVGAATGLVAAGLVAAAVGTALLASTFGDKGAAVLVLVVGVLVCLVGSHGGRRATTWAGAALAAIGLVAFIALSIQPESATATGLTVVLAGGLLVAIPLIVTRLRASNASSPDPVPPA